jgi:hypothetical protein
MSNASDNVFTSQSPKNKSRLIFISIASAIGIAAIVYGVIVAIQANEQRIIRAQLEESLPAAEQIQSNIMEYAQRHEGACVSKDGHEGTYGRFDHLFLQLESMAGQDDGFCAFELRIRNLSQEVDGKTLRWTWNPKQAGAKWFCNGGTLDEGYRPEACVAR